MPYIKQYVRPDIDAALQSFIKFFEDFSNWPSGNLNYVITKLLLETKPKSYEEYNALIGVLECVKLEFYRRQIAVYEDKKKEENGDVYE